MFWVCIGENSIRTTRQKILYVVLPSDTAVLLEKDSWSSRFYVATGHKPAHFAYQRARWCHLITLQTVTDVWQHL